MSKRIRFVCCQVERTYQVTTRKYLSGEVIDRRMVTGPCNTPLFDQDEMHTGVCRSCREGYEAENYIITPAGREYIAVAVKP